MSEPAKSEVVNVELVDEIQVHEHAEGGLQIIVRIFPAAFFLKKNYDFKILFNYLVLIEMSICANS